MRRVQIKQPVVVARNAMNGGILGRWAYPALILLNAVTADPLLASSSISCTGTIMTVGVHGSNRVMLQLSGMNTIVQICNLGQTVGTTYPSSPDQCKAQYATLLQAYALGSTINVYFDDAAVGSSCTNFAPWELAVARWVHLDS